MVSSRLNWHGESALKAILDAAWEGVLRATVHFWTALQLVLSIPAARVGKDYVPSNPGEPPRKRTGWLQKHVRYTIDRSNLKTWVGVDRNALYGMFLESGTRHLGARPWLMATLRREYPKLQAFFRQVKVR